MELTLVVQTGDDAGRRIPVPSGAPLRVGRAFPAEVLLVDDPMLSNLHFSIVCEPNGGRLRDLGSRFGTFLNGHKVLEAVLRNGDEIKAGRTVFAVALTGLPPDATPAAAAAVGPSFTVPPDDPTVPAADTETTLDRIGVVLAEPPPQPAGLSSVQRRLLDLLREQPAPLYALLDAAREPSIVNRLTASELEHQSLYDGEKGQELAPFGPWLVRLPPTTALLEELVRDGWGNSWGVYLTCERELADVRRHLRKFLTVKLPDGRQVYFRYYDPRVLRTYLPTCTPEELTSFFGPIRRYILESPDPTEALEFAAAHRDWRKATLTNPPV
jgi:hypothetical protein